MTYKAGIVKAIEELKERTGSSMQGIKKHMQAGLAVDKKWLNTTFLTALKAMVKDGDLVQVKGSYKLSPEFKKKRADALKPKKSKKAAPKKKTATKKRTAAKKTAPKKKKAAPKKKAPKKASTKKKTSSKKATPKKKTASKKKASSKKKSAKK
mmetsp:Transcript_14451/g.21299  ORF Transcript_14451/g.21299 Transcript_14451/m.21299 type:complete len:153 (-) Transcript_14451:235-693(-)|eukprot:CAMPEP_0195510964 /NCGR_PEP_ID=MMETSP0794_2-20130614/3451_1 /TAXON_ID=515487 /ORGANISM="Stephanopyxis turris, Strain CCMP 815" /LENGTH=152 /DNA_ID=CAMNT_0040638491 /DNA_START=85 /DNA_END=543 /DNA_ORIENTATION=-